MPNYGYHFARAEGRTFRQFYRALLPAIVRQPVRPRGSIPIEVFSYSGESALPEQVASIRSFLTNAGRPKKFTVVSDGSYTEASKKLLECVDACVCVESDSRHVPVSQASSGSDERTCGSTSLREYLSTHPTGKQLALIMSLPRNASPVLYVDSDVLFFPQARDLAILAESRGVPAFYLADCQFSGDARLIRGANELKNPVNTGVLLLFQQLDWSLSIQRFMELEGEPSFFTNQTMTHLTMHANGAQPLDPQKYVLQLDDQFIYPDRYASDALALRHYVNPVRHKFWMRLGRLMRQPRPSP